MAVYDAVRNSSSTRSRFWFTVMSRVGCENAHYEYKQCRSSSLIIRSQPTKHVQNSTAEGGNKVRVTRLSPRNSSLWPRRARVSTRMVGSRLVHVGDKLRSLTPPHTNTHTMPTFARMQPPPPPHHHTHAHTRRHPQVSRGDRSLM